MCCSEEFRHALEAEGKTGNAILRLPENSKSMQLVMNVMQ